MKKISKMARQLLLVGALLPTAVFAEDLASLSQPAPAQEYHAANGDNPALMPAQQPVAAPAPSVDTTDKSVSIVTNTQKEITDLAQNTLSFEQQSDQRIQALVDSNHAMGTAIQTLMQNVADLQQKLAQNTAASASAAGFLHGFRDPETQGLLIGVAGMLLLGAGVLLGRLWHSRAQAKVIVPPVSPSPKAVKEDTSEYDFMNTAQAIPAKLDLARSYIAMNEVEQAKAILKTVIEKGDDLHRREARVLLEGVVASV